MCVSVLLTCISVYHVHASSNWNYGQGELTLVLEIKPQTSTKKCALKHYAITPAP